MFIPRTTLNQLHNHLARPEISLILGPRQSGKTTTILKLKDELEHTRQPTAYFNLDRFEDRELFQTQKTLLDKIGWEFGNKKVVVFIDEIQRLPNAGLFLKGLYDYLTPHKFVVTGSGSLELKENIVEPLTGRKKIFYLYPLSFAEFFFHRTAHDVKDFGDFATHNAREAVRLLDEYLLFGGYPKVVATPTKEEKIEYLKEIYTSYLEKDVKSLLHVEKDLAYQHLLRYLSAETGSLLKKSHLAQVLDLNTKTLNRYLFLLEKTFVIKIVKPFYKNVTKELSKTPKVYFIDLGLRNFIAGGFDDFTKREDRGKLFENFVLRQLLDISPVFGISFWRTNLGAEVDFVVQTQDSILPLEAKAKEVKPGVVGKSLYSFLNKYQPPRAYIIHLGDETSVQKNNCELIYRKLVPTDLLTPTAPPALPQ